MRGDGVPVVVADEETVAVGPRGMGSNRPGSQDPRRKQSVSLDSRERFDASLAGMVPGSGDAVDADIASAVTDDDMVVSEKGHAVRLAERVGVQDREIRQGHVRRLRRLRRLR